MANRPKRRHARRWPPKGSYPHPASGRIGPTRQHGRIRATAHLKAEPDTRKLAEAVVQLAENLERDKTKGRRRSE